MPTPPSSSQAKQAKQSKQRKDARGKESAQPSAFGVVSRGECAPFAARARKRGGVEGFGANVKTGKPERIRVGSVESPDQIVVAEEQ